MAQATNAQKNYIGWMVQATDTQEKRTSLCDACSWDKCTWTHMQMNQLGNFHVELHLNHFFRLLCNFGRLVFVVGRGCLIRWCWPKRCDNVAIDDCKPGLTETIMSAFAISIAFWRNSSLQSTKSWVRKKKSNFLDSHAWPWSFLDLPINAAECASKHR